MNDYSSKLDLASLGELGMILHVILWHIDIITIIGMT